MQKLSIHSLITPLTTAFIVCGWIAGVWFLLPRAPFDPASVLPLDHTVAVLINADPQTTSMLKRMVTEADILPTIMKTVTTALIRKDDGTLGVATLDGHLFHSDDAGVTRVLEKTQTEPRLSTSSTYKLLTQHCAKECMYLLFPTLHLRPESPIASLITVKQPVALAIDGDMLDMSSIIAGTDHLAPLSFSPKDVFADPLFIVHTSNLNTLSHIATASMRAEPMVIIDTLLRTTLTDLLGNDVSPTYDLAPLLQGETTVQVAQGTGSTLRFVVEGDVGNHFDQLKDIVTTFRSRIGTATVDKRTFDDKFTIAVMRQDEQSVQSFSGTELGWQTIRLQSTTNDRAMFLGLRGSRYILSNDTTAFDHALQEQPEPFPVISDVPAALGLMKSDAVDSLLRQQAPTIWKNLSIPSGTGGFLKWKMMQEGERVRFVLKKI